MASFAYRVYGLPTNSGPHVLGHSANSLAADNIVEVWDGPTEAQNRWRIHSDGDVIPGPKTAADLSTSATDGFVFIRSGNGAPTGTPTHAANGIAPLYYDRSNDALYVYNGGWVSVSLS